MKKKIIIGICLMLVTVGMLGCVEKPGVPLTFSEMVDEYQEKYPDSETEIVIMWGNRLITVYHNCTSDEWIEWLDNLTRASLEIRWENYTPPEQKYGFEIYHRYIDPSLEVYESIEEKNDAKKEILINISLIKKESLMDTLWKLREYIVEKDYDHIELFESIVFDMSFIFENVRTIILIDRNQTTFNESNVLLETILSNLSSVHSLYWKTMEFGHYLQFISANYTKNNTLAMVDHIDNVILYFELFFDLVSDRENVPIHVYSYELGSLFFNFTGDGLTEAMGVCSSTSCSVYLPRGVIQITDTIRLSNGTMLSGSSMYETILYCSNSMHSVIEVNGVNNVSISDIQIFGSEDVMDCAFLFNNCTYCHGRNLYVRMDGHSSQVGHISIGG